MVNFNGALDDVTKALVDAGGSPFVVGGFVRDLVMGFDDSKDIDIEVHRLTVEQTLAALETVGPVDAVGKSFGVFKIRSNGLDLDVSLPRTDSKVGDGHTGFDVQVDPFMGIVPALQRRDFTINAMAIDLVMNEFIDPFGGRADIKHRKLTAVSDAFDEDPLRVVRAIQFAARFSLFLDPDTAARCRKLVDRGEIEFLSIERIWVEFEKIASKTTDFRALVLAIQDTGTQGLFGEVSIDRFGTPIVHDLEPGPERTAIMFAALGIDPVKVGAPVKVVRLVEGINEALTFDGSRSESRSFARRLTGGATFGMASRIERTIRFDPIVHDGPLKPLLSGHEIMDELGLSEGREVGHAIQIICSAHDAKKISNRDEALRFLRGHF